MKCLHKHYFLWRPLNTRHTTRNWLFVAVTLVCDDILKSTNEIENVICFRPHDFHCRLQFILNWMEEGKGLLFVHLFRDTNLFAYLVWNLKEIFGKTKVLYSAFALAVLKPDELRIKKKLKKQRKRKKIDHEKWYFDEMRAHRKMHVTDALVLLCRTNFINKRKWKQLTENQTFKFYN